MASPPSTGRERPVYEMEAPSGLRHQPWQGFGLVAGGFSLRRVPFRRRIGMVSPSSTGRERLVYEMEAPSGLRHQPWQGFGLVGTLACGGQSPTANRNGIATIAER